MQHFHKRNGPRPLWLHLNAGAAMMAAASQDKNMFVASQDILMQALDGVKGYHDSPVQPYKRTMKKIVSCNGSSIITGKSWDSQKYVLIIPSLINGWGIFDIEDNFSFAAYLHDSGLTPLIVDWAIPETDITMDDYITYHLAPLLRQIIADKYDLAGVIGYCMGGTMIAALTSAFPEFKGLLPKQILIAPPWDFSYQSMEQNLRIQSLAIQTYVMDDVVPTDFVQSLFWAVDPLQVLKKFRKFPNVSNADRFVRVEDWLNEGRAVSKSVIQTCLFNWYRDNKIMMGEWRINDKPVNLKNMGDDTMIVYGKNDNLVPYDSIKPMGKLLPHAKFVAVDTGHIGLMASDKSRNAAWKPIAEFLKKDKV